MTTRTDTSEIEALSRLLDAYGADEHRWPEGATARFRPLLARDEAARTLLAEARALDLTLDAARSEPALDRAIAERIVAAALAGQRPGSTRAAAGHGETAANVVPVRRREAAAAPVAAPRRTGWQAAALMAASLMAGVYVGGNGVMTPVVERLAEVAGITIEGDPIIALLGQEAMFPSEEELL